METTSILAWSSGGTFAWTCTIDERSHFQNFGRQQPHKNSFTHHYGEHNIRTISEDNSIKIFYPICLLDMGKNYTIIVSIWGISSGKKSSIQFPHQWRTFDFHQYLRLLHSFNFSERHPTSSIWQSGKECWVCIASSTWNVLSSWNTNKRRNIIVLKVASPWTEFQEN